MEIRKGEKVFTVTETKKLWLVKAELNGVEVVYNVNKDMAEDFDALDRYVHECDLF